MYLPRVSVGLVATLAVVAFGSAEASARGRPTGPSVAHASNAATPAKSHSRRTAKGKSDARSVAELAPFRYQGSWKNSRL
jgi:hypothetical protein